MLAFLLAPENIAFSAAFVLMALIGLMEVFGLGAGLIGDVDVGVDAEIDADADISAAGSVLQWLNLGRLPLLAFLVVLLTSFALTGLIAQRLLLGATGMLLPLVIAAPAAFVASLPVTRVLSAGLARIMPRDETTAVSLDSLVGRLATIVLGTAGHQSPAEARVRDRHGQTHYIMVEPDRPEVTFKQTETVLLVRRSGSTFYAIRPDSDALSSG